MPPDPLRDKVDSAPLDLKESLEAPGARLDGSVNVKTSSEPSEPQVETEDAVSNGEKPVAAKAADKGLKASMSSQIEDLVATVRRLEAFAAVEARRVSDKVIPQVETRARQNIWVSLLMALGLGIIVGIWLTGGRRRD